MCPENRAPEISSISNNPTIIPCQFVQSYAIEFCSAGSRGQHAHEPNCMGSAGLHPLNRIVEILTQPTGVG
jgi:hypothetical protein